VPGKSRRAAATAYGRRPKSTSDDDDDGLAAVTGHRHGHRSRSLAGFFGRVEIEVLAPGLTARLQSPSVLPYENKKA
jgi:hypothetical protein